MELEALNSKENYSIRKSWIRQFFILSRELLNAPHSPGQFPSPGSAAALPAEAKAAGT